MVDIFFFDGKSEGVAISKQDRHRQSDQTV
jgi:hypothetical protein